MLKILRRFKHSKWEIRPRKRYIVFEVKDSQKIQDPKMFGKSIIKDLKLNIQASENKPLLVKFISEKWNKTSQRGIVRVNHMYGKDVIGYLNGLRKLNNKEIKINTLGTSGILKKAYYKYIAG